MQQTDSTVLDYTCTALLADAVASSPPDKLASAHMPAPSRVDQHAAVEIAAGGSSGSHANSNTVVSFQRLHKLAGGHLPHAHHPIPAPEPGGSGWYWNHCGISATTRPEDGPRHTRQQPARQTRQGHPPQPRPSVCLIRPVSDQLPAGHLPHCQLAGAASIPAPGTRQQPSRQARQRIGSEWHQSPSGVELEGAHQPACLHLPHLWTFRSCLKDDTQVLDPYWNAK